MSYERHINSLTKLRDELGPIKPGNKENKNRGAMAVLCASVATTAFVVGIGVDKWVPAMQDKARRPDAVEQTIEERVERIRRGQATIAIRCLQDPEFTQRTGGEATLDGFVPEFFPTRKNLSLIVLRREACNSIVAIQGNTFEVEADEAVRQVGAVRVLATGINFIDGAKTREAAACATSENIIPLAEALGADTPKTNFIQAYNNEELVQTLQCKK